MRRSLSTSAAAVSSQLDSRPRMRVIIARSFTRPFIDRATRASSLRMNDLPTPENPLRIGTRASPLAMAQAHMAMAALLASHGLDMTALEIVPMTATGDRIQDRALADVGGKALWKRELDAR